MGVVIVCIVVFSCWWIFVVLWLEFNIGGFLLRIIDVYMVNLSGVGYEC